MHCPWCYSLHTTIMISGQPIGYESSWPLLQDSPSMHNGYMSYTCWEWESLDQGGRLSALSLIQDWHSYWVSSYLANPAAMLHLILWHPWQTLKNVPIQHWLSSNLIGWTCIHTCFLVHCFNFIHTSYLSIKMHDYLIRKSSGHCSVLIS